MISSEKTFKCKDVFDFQRKHQTRRGRERQLRKMDAEEIMHIAHSCGIIQGKIYYARFAKEAEAREKTRAAEKGKTQ